MLLQLNIKNFALIEKLSISFDRGFNVLTGETGAGKSIIIDAINYVLGAKFNKDIIRTGEDKTYVEALFSIDNPSTELRLKELEMDYDDILILSRETLSSGKSVAKINDKTVLLNNLKYISETLLDVHGQHENQKLLDNSTHIDYLDYFCSKELKDEKLLYLTSFKELKELEASIEEHIKQHSAKDTTVDFVKFQIEDINKLKLKINEEEELQDEFSILSNAEKINMVLRECYNILYEGTESQTSIEKALNIVIKELRSIENAHNSIKGIVESFETAYYSITEDIDEIRRIDESVVYDAKRLDEINSRLYQISLAKKKYGGSISEILQYKLKLEEQLNKLINYEENIELLNQKKKKIEENLEAVSLTLSEKRKKYAKKLKEAIESELKYVGLEKCVFEIQINRVGFFKENGKDEVAFLISPNPGEPTRPLSKIASGGELSRIMLALKSVFMNEDKTSSVIFDEIDTGISGKVAQSVAEKMFLLSNKHQVFTVTHLPQIAAMSDHHYRVEKVISENKTFTKIYILDNENKTEEVAKMIGGSNITPLTKRHAEEYVSLAQTRKKELLKRYNIS